MPRNHSRLRRGLLDGAVALVLAAATLAGLLATSDIGFPRDEGFYFRYAADYQDWFVRVEEELGREGGMPSLGKEDVSEVWAGNAEHPPLAKILFGYSWRLFGEKRRALARIEARAGDEIAVIEETRPAEGFRVGQDVWLLAPDLVDAPRPALERVIGRATVVERRGALARARLADDGGALRAASFAALCKAPAGTGPVPATFGGCEALPVSSGTLAETTAFRLPSMVLTALLVAMIWLFGAGTIGRLGALAAALSFILVPRTFFHAHLTAFDMPITAMIFFTVAAFWKSLRSRWWAVATGVLWGLAILTKHNALFLPVALGGWWLAGARVVAGPRARVLPETARRVALGLAALAVLGGAAVGGKLGLGAGLGAVLIGLVVLGRRIALPPMPLAFVTMPLIGLPLFVALWPRLWYDGFANFLWYLSFHLKHDHYMQTYFGDVLAYPPLPVSFPFVMTLLTVPLAIMALGLAGAGVLAAPWVRARWEQRGEWLAPSTGARSPWTFGALLGVNTFYPIALIALPSTPIFGGVKHWLPAMPFFALLAGIGFDRLVRAMWELVRVRRPWARGLVAAALLAVCLAPAARATLHAHPNGTAYYNELIGGAPGAADAGMQRQFWGYPTRLAMDYLNRHVPKGAAVYFHKSPWGCWDLYRKEGLLRRDIRHVADIFDMDVIVGRLRSTAYGVFHHQKDHDDYELAIWEAYGTDAPVWQATQDGVPIVSVYRNPAWQGRGR